MSQRKKHEIKIKISKFLTYEKSFFIHLDINYISNQISEEINIELIRYITFI